MDKRTLDETLNGAVSKLKYGKYHAIEIDGVIKPGEKVSQFGMHYTKSWHPNQLLSEHSTFEASGAHRKSFKYYYNEAGQLYKEVWEEEYGKPSVTKEYKYLQGDSIDILVTFANGKVFDEQTRKGFDSHLSVPRKKLLNTSEERLQQSVTDLKRTFTNGFFRELKNDELVYEAGYLNASGGLFNRFVYRLNSDGQIVETFWERPDLDVKATVRYKYAPDGHIIEECFLNKDGTPGSIFSYQYTFDEHNNWVRVIEFDNNKAKYIYARDIEYF
jgi:hypothetical protein